MKQRIGIAQALLNDPKILIVDEPTVGLDTEGRIRFRHLLADLAGDRVVILSTHIVSDVEVTANDIASENTDRRPGDPPVLIASNEKAIAELGWRPVYTDLDDIIGTAWRWHQNL